MITPELIERIAQFLKGEELYYVDSQDNLDFLNADQWLEFIRTGYIEDDITDNWDISYALSDIRCRLIEHFNPGSGDTPEYGEAFFDEHHDEITDLIYEHCSNDVMPQLLRNTNSQNIIHVIGDINDVDLGHEIEFAEEYSEYDLAAFRLGILLGRSIEDMIQMYKDHEEGKESDYRQYYSIYSEGFGYTKLCIAYRLDADEIPNIHKLYTNGDKVALHNGDVGVINNTDGSGFMDANNFKVNPVFIFDINQCYHDDAMGRYGYYSDVCGDDSNEGYLMVVARAEVPLVTEDPLASTRALEAEYEATYKNGGCTFGDTKYDRHRNTKYINEYPCGTHCMTCGQFWID